MAYKVFFSHSQRDEKPVKWMARNLTGKDIAVYLFKYDLQPGNYVAKKVQNAIKECDCFMVLITQNSERSNYVQQEIGFAEGQEKRVLAMVEVGIDSSRLAMLEGREYIKFDRSHPNKALSDVSQFLSQSKQTKNRNNSIGLGVIAGLLLSAFLFADDDSD